MNRSLLIKNTTIVTPLGSEAVKGSRMGNLRIIPQGAILIREGKIAFVGKQEDCEEYLRKLSASNPFHLPSDCIIDAEGRVSLPGFVDSHTHLIFGGYRPDEFEWRMKGDTYMSIMERGGGIQSTVNATRTESVEALAEKGKWFVNRMVEMGVTTVEAKSGYGLDTETELKMLDAIRMISDDPEAKLRVVPTFLGAHAVPAEYKGRTGEYVDLIIDEMIPLVKDKAEFCDIFTEKNVFEIEDSRRLQQAAAQSGMKLKFHADEIVTLGGAELAAELGAVSADHLLHVSDAGVKDMAETGVVATLLPLTAFSLKEPFAPARKLIEAGCAVALATDLNPGSCFSGSIPLTIALACIYMNMSIEETITALTLNGAAALDAAADYGSIEVGKSGDVVILEYDNYRMLPYYVGMNCVRTVISRGRVVHG